MPDLANELKNKRAMADSKNRETRLPEKFRLNGQFEKLSSEQKREVLLERAQYYQKSIRRDVNKIGLDVLKIGLVAGTAYLSYRITKYLILPKREKKSKEVKNKPNIETSHSSEKASNSNSIWNMIRNRLLGFFLDTVLDELKDKIQKRNSGDDE